VFQLGTIYNIYLNITNFLQDEYKVAFNITTQTHKQGEILSVYLNRRGSRSSRAIRDSFCRRDWQILSGGQFQALTKLSDPFFAAHPFFHLNTCNNGMTFKNESLNFVNA
jgi:hypothetical protein